jgi:hypothetical protein
MSTHRSTPEPRPGGPGSAEIPPPIDARAPSPPSPPSPPIVIEPPPSQPVELGGLISGLLNSLTTAKQQADASSASVTQSYSKDPILRNFTVPVFNVQELEIDLRFAVQRVETPTQGEAKISRIFVNVDATTLSGMKAEYLVNAKLKIIPANFRIYQSDDKQVVVPG